MSTAEAAAPEAAPTAYDAEAAFLTPAIAQGDPVVWMTNKGATPSPARVLAVGMRTIDLIYFSQDSAAGSYLTGVPYVGAPAEVLERSLRTETGCWDYTSQGKRITELEKQIGDLPEQLAQVQAKLDHVRAAGRTDKPAKT